MDENSKGNHTKEQMQGWRRIPQENWGLVITRTEEIKRRVLTRHEVFEPGLVADTILPCLHHPLVMPMENVLHTLILLLHVSAPIAVLLAVEDPVAEGVGTRVHG